MISSVVQTPTAQLYDLPIIGDDFANIGRIIDIYSSPCSPTAELWVYGFFQAIPTMFITLTKPELIDINIRKGAHRRRKGRRLKFRASDLFRDALVEIPVPRWVVFRIYEWTERIGWYFLVADATEEFAINWMSLAYKWNGCQGAIPPYSTKENDLDLQVVNAAPTTVFMAATSVNQMEVTNAYTGVIVPGRYRCSWSITWAPWGVPSENSVPYATVLQQQNGATWDNVALGEGSVIPNGGNISTGDTTLDLLGGENFRLASLGTHSGFAYATGLWELSALKIDALGPDP